MRLHYVTCYGCECDVPVVAGRHEEPTDVPGLVYRYACTIAEAPRCPACRGDGKVLVREHSRIVATYADCGACS